MTCLDLMGLGGESVSFEICEQTIFGGRGQLLKILLKGLMKEILRF